VEQRLPTVNSNSSGSEEQEEVSIKKKQAPVKQNLSSVDKANYIGKPTFEIIVGDKSSNFTFGTVPKEKKGPIHRDPFKPLESQDELFGSQGDLLGSQGGTLNLNGSSDMELEEQKASTQTEITENF